MRKKKSKIIFSKCYILDWSEETFVKSAVSWMYEIGDFSGEENAETFSKKEFKKIK